MAAPGRASNSAQRQELAEAKKRVKELEREALRNDKALAEAAALLLLEKKTPVDWVAQRGRQHGKEERRVIRELVDAAVVQGARQEAARVRLGVSERTLQRWQLSAEDGRQGPHSAPANKLSDVERQVLVAVANSAQFRDVSPKQMVPSLADEGSTWAARRSSTEC